MSLTLKAIRQKKTKFTSKTTANIILEAYFDCAVPGQ